MFEKVTAVLGEVAEVVRRGDAAAASSALSADSCVSVVKTQDRKVRRAIANSNERRRMQSINAGFDSLKRLVCPHDKDKLSKASVLQQAVDYICILEHEKRRLLASNARYKRLVRSLGHDPESVSSDDEIVVSIPAPHRESKRRKQDTESSDEGVGGMTSDGILAIVDMKRELSELRAQLELERRIRDAVEQKFGPLVNDERASAKRKHSSLVKSERGDVVVKENTQRTDLLSSPGTLMTSPHGNLQTIVEAIRHLESSDQDMTSAVLQCVEDEDYVRRVDIVDSATKCYDKSSYDSLTTSMASCDVSPSSCAATELARIIAAAEALQYIAGGRSGVHRFGAGLLHRGGSPVSYQQQLVHTGFVVNSS